MGEYFTMSIVMIWNTHKLYSYLNDIFLKCQVNMMVDDSRLKCIQQPLPYWGIPEVHSKDFDQIYFIFIIAAKITFFSYEWYSDIFMNIFLLQYISYFKILDFLKFYYSFKGISKYRGKIIE